MVSEFNLQRSPSPCVIYEASVDSDKDNGMPVKSSRIQAYTANRVSK